VSGRLGVALASGALFGAGLAVSGMLDPVRVRGFLDLFGRWDPTLAFVMGGAILPMVVAWLVQRRMAAPIAAEGFHLPDTGAITPKLVGGAALFGIGWGLAGLCPGPGIASLVLHPREAGLFVVMMFAGFALVALAQRRPKEGER
jgi:uncharacterized membrane protein YedE/YeeE